MFPGNQTGASWGSPAPSRHPPPASLPWSYSRISGRLMISSRVYAANSQRQCFSMAHATTSTWPQSRTWALVGVRACALVTWTWTAADSVWLPIASFPGLSRLQFIKFLHAASNQKLEAGTAWERGWAYCRDRRLIHSTRSYKVQFYKASWSL